MKLAVWAPSAKSVDLVTPGIGEWPWMRIYPDIGKSKSMILFWRMAIATRSTAASRFRIRDLLGSPRESMARRTSWTLRG